MEALGGAGEVMLVQDGVDGVLKFHHTTWQSNDSPIGNPSLVSQQTRAARASHPAATALAWPSWTSCCRSKWPICCDNTEVGGFIGAPGLRQSTLCCL
jgi:hypothetical protein